MSDFELLRIHSAERVISVLALAVGCAACSGSKLVGRDYDDAGIVGVGGAGANGGSGSTTGGQPSLLGGSSAVAATGGAVAATGGAVAATGGAVAATGGAVAATGGAVSTGGISSTGCTQLSCLAGHRFVYQANRVWQRPNLGGWDPLPESEYAPVTDAPKYLLQFSATGAAASLAEIVSTQYPDPYGTLDSQDTTSVTYKFEDGWTGEQFIVNQGTNGLEGDLTFWGSGVPIVEATRGPLTFTQDYDDHGDECGLPLGVLPTYFPATYENTIAAGSVCGETCVGLRNGYCNGSCSGYLVWENRCWAAHASVAFDPATHAMVGYVWGDESAPICRGHFPPHAADGSKGWDLGNVSVALTCK